MAFIKPKNLRPMDFLKEQYNKILNTRSAASIQNAGSRVILWGKNWVNVLYAYVTYTIIGRECPEIIYIKRACSVLVGLTVADALLRNSKIYRKKTAIKQTISLILHMASIVIFLMVLKRILYCGENFDSLKMGIYAKLTDDNNKIPKLCTILSLVFIPLSLVNSFYRVIQSYNESKNNKDLKMFYDPFTGKFDEEKYFNDTKIYNVLCECFPYLIKSIISKNMLIGVCLVAAKVFNLGQTNLISRRKSILLLSSFTILADLYTITTPLIEIIAKEKERITNL